MVHFPICFPILICSAIPYHIILQAGQSYASDFIKISPEKQIAMADRKFEVKMKLDDGAGGNIKVYKTNSEHFSTWEQVDAEIQDGTASFQVG